MDEAVERSNLSPEKCLKFQWNYNTDGNISGKLIFGCSRIVEQEFIMSYQGDRRMAQQWFGYKEGKKDTLRGQVEAYQYYLDGRLKARISRNLDFSEFSRNDWTYELKDSAVVRMTLACGICPEYREFEYHYNPLGQLKKIIVTNMDNGDLGFTDFIYNHRNQLITKIVGTKEGLLETIMEPDQSAVNYEYGENGNLLVKTEVHLESDDFRKKTTYEYNENNLLMRENIYLAPDKLSYYLLYEFDYY